MAEKKEIKKVQIKFDPIDIEARKALDFHAGDTVRVSSKILDEKGRFRLQAFEGIVLARKHGTEVGATFTVRKVASGVGVERIFPLFSPVVDTIEIVKKSHARRAKLYYVRTKAVKDVRRKLRSTVLNKTKNIDIETEEEIEKEVEVETKN